MLFAQIGQPLPRMTDSALGDHLCPHTSHLTLTRLRDPAYLLKRVSVGLAVLKSSAYSSGFFRIAAVAIAIAFFFPHLGV